MSVAPNDLDPIVGFCRSLIWALCIWGIQALGLFCTAWVAARLDRSRSATVRYQIWLVTFLTVAALPVLGAISRILLPYGATIPIAWPGGTTDPALPGTSAESPAKAAFSWTLLVWPVLCVIWAAGMTVSLARFGRSFRVLNQIRSRARLITAADLRCAGLEPQLRRSRRTEIALSADVRSPMLVGLFRPAILLPSDILSWTSPEERTSILRHELAHIRRHDSVVHLFATILKACHFYHPMVRFACGQLSLERELACDERVLGLGTAPEAYIESILKAVERNLQNDAVHCAASFASRRNLERRIDMILDAARMKNRSRQWRFLLLPLVLIVFTTWLMLPGAPANTASESGEGAPDIGGASGPENGPPPSQTGQSRPVVDNETIWVETVKRGTMAQHVRGRGVLLSDTGGRFKAEIRLPEQSAKGVEVGQPASIDTRKGIVPGKVIRVRPDAVNGSIAVEVSLEGNLPPGLRPGLDVDGTILIRELKNTLYIGRPVRGQPDSTIALYRIDADGTTATRVQVRLGQSSINTIQILDGLKEGEKVIISDLSMYEALPSIRLK